MHPIKKAPFLIHALCCLLFLSLPLLTPSDAHAQERWRKVNMGWTISCDVDDGAIKKEKKTYTFSTSHNHCTGGTFNQRAEIYTKEISVSKRATYLFDTTIAFNSSKTNEFYPFQIHDGRNGCAPPLTMGVRPNGTIQLDSDYTQDRGMNGCVHNEALRRQPHKGPRIRRDGTAQRLQVRLDFDGKGAFDITVYIDQQNVISGRYDPPTEASLVRSNRFYMKHGVYSKNIFPYTMTSTDMKTYKLVGN